MCSIFCSNGKILTKLALIHHWNDFKKWLDFGDLDLIFIWVTNTHHVIYGFEKALSALFLATVLPGFDQTGTNTPLGDLKK